MQATVGTVGEIEGQFEWSISDFFSLPEKADECYCSPDIFHFLDASWYLRIYPNGENRHHSVGWIGVYLVRGDSGPPVTVTCTLALKAAGGQKEKECLFTYVFDQDIGGCGPKAFLSRSQLVREKSKLAPSDFLVITCSLRHGHPKNPLGEQMLEKGRVEASTQTEAELPRGIEKLSQDLNGLMVSGDDSDLTIRVKGEEFRLHRNILGARTPVFQAMFRHEMREKTTGVVSIDDCEADTFQSFLHYVYTGTVDKLSPENVFGVFEVADKYQVDELKADCLECMKDTLSIDTFCQAVSLALAQDEKELMELAIDLLSDKTIEIMVTVKWQNFLMENPIEANELLIKAAVKNKK